MRGRARGKGDKKEEERMMRGKGGGREMNKKRPKKRKRNQRGVMRKWRERGERERLALRISLWSSVSFSMRINRVNRSSFVSFCIACSPVIVFYFRL